MEFKQLEDIICSCASTGKNNKTSIVYARVDSNRDICTITGGNLYDMMNGLSHIIKHLSIKSGAPTSLIIKMISVLLEVNNEI